MASIGSLSGAPGCSSSAFPHLPSTSNVSLLGPRPAGIAIPLSATNDRRPSPTLAGCNWRDLLLSQSDRTNAYALSFFPPSSSEVQFTEDDILDGQIEWNLSLVGYAIGKRPFYGSLLSAIKKKWRFKGSFELLTLEGDFFLLKFSCQEDFDIVWDNGPCFLNGRPFVFQKWDWKFRPTKENCSEIPLWIKLPNLPLCCWNEKGISKIASMVGVPLAVDSLTASRSRITFARVCVQVSSSTALPESVTLNLNGTKYQQPIQYDWKPNPCRHCETFSHEGSSCPANSQNKPNPRGRSRSRPPLHKPNPLPGRSQHPGIAVTPAIPPEGEVSRSNAFLILSSSLPTPEPPAPNPLPLADLNQSPRSPARGLPSPLGDSTAISEQEPSRDPNVWEAPPSPVTDFQAPQMISNPPSGEDHTEELDSSHPPIPTVMAAPKSTTRKKGKKPSSSSSSSQ